MKRRKNEARELAKEVWEEIVLARQAMGLHQGFPPRWIRRAFAKRKYRNRVRAAFVFWARR